MSTENESQNDPTLETTQSEPSPTQAPSGTASSDEDSSLPEHWRGKSKAEIAQIAEQLFNQLATAETPSQQEEPVRQRPQQPSQTPQASAGPDPQLAWDDTRAWQDQLMRAIDERVNTTIGQYAQPVMQQVGLLAQQASRQSDNPRIRKAWSKYGPEIVQMVNQQIPAQNRTKEAWDMAAKVVLANHMDEIVREEAERLGAQGAPVTESATQTTENTSPSIGDAIDQFWTSDHPRVRRMKEKQLSKSDVREHARVMGLAPEKYIEMIKSGNVISDDKTTRLQVS